MSLKRQSILAPSPTTVRSRPTHLSADPKGEKLAYAANKSIFLRSIDDPSNSVQYNQHTHPTTVARFSPSGYYVASGDASGMVRVWDCAGEDQILKGEYPVISGRINDLAWDGESKRIIAVGEGKEKFGHAFTFDTGNSVGSISGHSSPINSVSIRPVRPYRAATASDDHTVVFMHGPPFNFNSQLRDHHSNFVHGVAFSPSGEHLISVSSDKKIVLYDGKTGEYKSTLGTSGGDGHTGTIFSISWSADSKRFVTSSADQTVKIWDLETAKTTNSWKIGTGVPYQQVGVVWPNRSDGTIISLSLSGDLNYLNEKEDKPYKVVSGHQKSITSMGVAEGGKTLFTGSYEGRVCSWDVASGLATQLSGESHTNQISGIELVDDKIVSVAWDDTLRTVDIQGKAFTGKTATDGQPKGISATGKGDTIVIATHKSITVYSGEKKLASISPTWDPTVLAASHGNPDIAVGATDNTIHIFTHSSTSLTEKTVITRLRSVISSLAFSPDGRILAAGDASGRVLLYDRQGDGTFTARPNDGAIHLGRVTRVAFSDDGEMIASGALDTNLIVCKVADTDVRAKVTGAHKDGVNALAWVEGGRLASAGADGAVKVWEVKL